MPNILTIKCLTINILVIYCLNNQNGNFVQEDKAQFWYKYLIYKETYFGNKTTKNIRVLFKLPDADISHDYVTKELIKFFWVKEEQKEIEHSLLMRWVTLITSGNNMSWKNSGS